MKNFDIFLIFAQNINCGYTFLQQKYSCIPQFYYIQVGFKGVYIARTCFPDVVIYFIAYRCVNFGRHNILQAKYLKESVFVIFLYPAT